MQNEPMTKNSWITVAAILVVLVCLAAILRAQVVHPAISQYNHMRYIKTIQSKAVSVEQKRKYLLSAFESDPLCNRVMLSLAQHYYIAEKDYVAAEKYLRLAMALYNGDLNAWSLYYLLGELCLSRGDIPGAERAFRRSLYYFPRFEEAIGGLERVRKIKEQSDSVILRFR